MHASIHKAGHLRFADFSELVSLASHARSRKRVCAPRKSYAPLRRWVGAGNGMARNNQPTRVDPEPVMLGAR